MNRQVDRLEDDGQSENPSRWDARRTHTGCCGRDPGGGEGRSQEGPWVVGGAAGGQLLCPGSLLSREGSGGWAVPAAATPHSQDGDNLHEVQGPVVELCNEHGSHTLEEGGTVHVDRGTDGQNEAADVSGHSILLLHTLHHQRQRGGAARTTDQSHCSLPKLGHLGPAHRPRHAPDQALGQAPPTAPPLGHKLRPPP